ncbi:MAG: ABC transporter ATP-binding protein [Planctomycetota bacterium]|nr:ABC transporter ATP-binding protein [Planctomycetota bacterium]
MILTQKLTKKYGNHVALVDLDLEVKPGEILGFLGPNGAGKSTALRILSGYLPPTSGTCSINGKDLALDSLGARRCTGYLPENFVAPSEMRVQEYLLFRARLKGLGRKEAKSSVAQISKRLGLEPRMRQTFASLSKGFRQRVGLADVLLANPPAVLLDEPFTGLDPIQRQEFREILLELAAAGKAVLFSSHVLPEVEEIATRVQILNHGHSRAVGTLDELHRVMQREASLILVLEAGFPEAQSKLEVGRQSFDFELESHSPTQFELHLRKPNMRPKIFSWLAKEGFPVLEFRENRPDLDQLFRTLVEADSA